MEEIEVPNKKQLKLGIFPVIVYKFLFYGQSIPAEKYVLVIGDSSQRRGTPAELYFSKVELVLPLVFCRNLNLSLLLRKLGSKHIAYYS